MVLAISVSETLTAVAVDYLSLLSHIRAVESLNNIIASFDTPVLLFVCFVTRLTNLRETMQQKFTSVDCLKRER